jgi:multidrug transporter EmrE-like cation transporter
MQFVINHLYIFLTVAFAVLSQLIIKWKMSAFSFSDYETLTDKFVFAFSMLLNPYIIISLILTLLSGLSWMIAMTKFDISYAYPFTTLGFVFILFFSMLIFNEPLSWQKVVGLIFIISGIIISSRSI